MPMSSDVLDIVVLMKHCTTVKPEYKKPRVNMKHNQSSLRAFQLVFDICVT